MKIGIDGSRAFLGQRTGIEEYSYQVIKNLRDHLKDHQVILYTRKKQIIDFDLPKNWKIKEIKWPRFWTQIGLSLEMLLGPVDQLFVPAHTVPFIHPKGTVVVIHGLEYEFCPQAYSWWERLYMRWSIKMSCKWANKIISVSENTKKDLVNLYEVPAQKIQVVYEGYSCPAGQNFQFPISNFQSNTNVQNSNFKIESKFKIQNSKFILFLGRIEERKNVVNIVKAFGILKEKYQISHKLVLAGKPGYGYENFKFQISNFKFKDEVLELGFVSEEEKWELLKNADVFVFPTLYEGFGIPILEAQSVGCPVVASSNSSIKEVTQYSLLPLGEDGNGADEGGISSCHSGLDPESRDKKELDSRFRGNDKGLACSALLVDPKKPQEIADAIWQILANEEKRKDLIEKGRMNVKRFSWKKCASEIARIIGC